MQPAILLFGHHFVPDHSDKKPFSHGLTQATVPSSFSCWSTRSESRNANETVTFSALAELFFGVQAGADSIHIV